MLQNIRKYTQGWIAWIIMSVIAAAFVLWGLEYYLTQNSGQQTVVASVNGKKITVSQVTRTYEELQKLYTQRGGPLDPAVQNQLRNMALQQLIADNVLLQTAEKQGFRVSMEQVQQAILGIPEFQVNGRFSPERFRQLLSGHAFTPEFFLQHLQASLLIDLPSLGIRQSAFLLPGELAQAYSLFEQRRSFGYFILPTGQFIAQSNPTINQIKIYYTKNKDQFMSPEEIKLAYLLLTPAKLTSQVTISPAEIQQYYRENLAQFKIPKRWLINKVLIKVPANVSTQQRQRASELLKKWQGELKQGKPIAQLP